MMCTAKHIFLVIYAYTSSNSNIWKDPDSDLLSRFQVESVCGNSNQIATHNVDILLIQPMTNVKEF